MADHKFEPGQLVLVRDADNDTWQLAHYDYLRESGMHGVIGGFGWNQCIPLNEETKHLHRTSQPYEPPKPPQEYEWGQKVEVFNHQSKEWRSGVFVLCDEDSDIPCGVVVRGKRHVEWVKADRIRPLTDDTAAH